MPPRHPRRATPQVLPAPHAIVSLWCSLIALCLLMASGVARVHAQSMPPGVVAPADPFHQSCVAVKASPTTVEGPRSFAMPAIPPQSTRNRIVHKQYVDLDDRCATPPAFAPTRDTDSTTVWYVDAPARDRHPALQSPGASTWHDLAS